MRRVSTYARTRPLMQTTPVASSLARPVAHRPRATEVAAVAARGAKVRIVSARAHNRRQGQTARRGNSDAVALVDSRILGGARLAVTAPSSHRNRRVAIRVAANYSEFPVAERRAELQKMTTAQLKPMCKGSGLKVGGKKGDLIDRLLEHEFGTTDDEADVDPTADIVGLAKEWRSGRVVSPTSGLSFGDLDALERLALGSSPRVDERGADEAYHAQSYEDGSHGGYDGSDRTVGSSGAAARLVGRTGAFDDGGGAGWDDSRSSSGGDGWDRGFNEDDPAPRTRDVEPEPVPTREQKADAAKKAARTERVRLGKRSAIVTALRDLATSKDGFESDPRVHLEAVSRAIDRAYRKLRYSAFAEMDPRGRDVCVDINVAEGTVAVLAQRIGRGGTVEWEKDDTDAFLEAYGKRHMIRKIAHMYTEELNEQVSAVAADSYRAKRGEMVECTVVAEGRRGEYLLRLDDGAMACLPEEESIPGKKYSQGERVCALVLDVEDRTWAADRRAPVIVSTAIAGLLAEVLAAEVPEVARGDVVIKSVARVSGKMSKVAVARREGVEKVFDPVLACVGVENSRLRAIRERLGGEVCQILTWSDNREDMVAEALFPAAVHRVVKAEEDDMDERALDKFIAYVSRFDEAKAIGAGGVNVKLAAALTGCFILIERHEEGGGAGGGWGDQRANSRGGDTRDTTGGWTAAGGRNWNEPKGGGWDDDEDAGGWNDASWKDDGWKDEQPSTPGRRGGAVDIDPNSMEFLDPETFGLPDGSAKQSTNQSRFEDLLARGKPEVDDLGWPDLDPLPSDVSDGDDVGLPDLDPLAPMESNIDDSLEDYLAGTPPPAGARGGDDSFDPRDDADNWEEVGPGKAGVVTFGASGAGVGGAAMFMGDGPGAGGGWDDGFEQDDAPVSWN